MATSTINPWSAGSVVIDQRPFMQFYERQMARQQAKDDALNNYFKDLGKNLTTSGMRSQDVPALLKKQQEWQQIGIQNKGALLNPKVDNGQTLMDYQQRYNDMQALINESKNAAKSMDEIGKMKLNPQMSYVFEDPNVINQIQSHELPIGDPNRQGINLATFSLPPQPITTKDLEGYQKYLTGGVPFDKIPGQIENLGGFKTRTPIYQQYSPENQHIIGQHAMNAYETDPKWRREAVRYFKELQNDPMEYERANSLHRQLYGNDIDSPKEAWAAKGILDNNMKATEYKEGKDELGMQLFMQKIRHADAKDLIKYKKDIDPDDKEMNNLWYQTYLDDVINTAKQSGERHHVYTNKGKSILYYNEIKADPFLMKAFQRGKSEPDRLGVTESGEIIPIFFRYNDKGEKQTVDGAPEVDTDYSKAMSYDQALINLGYRGRTKKQLGEDLNKGVPKQKVGKYPLPAGQHRKIMNPDTGFEYEWDENTGTYK